ncbi:cell division protein CrgA [Gordonia sp. (in: high G+C Gram-positive bacteria)]|uniref:cell division protein CrgA n=1 Tax=Gordonia sp. (in: high G+C Gram-positive bacteria) TaxID=84139 RepID=UPI0016A64EE9|nr:cell division protein CrgA [Gordonia sp. (in: high G+C Gram-positive bacteria)]NLG47761.1 cell division protein CrgA [Gordonia sp. (in: high G+C Gram-positive bacteria)]
MPKSKVRKKTDYTINTASRTPVKVKAGPSGVLYQSVMFGLMLIGLVWLMVYYLGASVGQYSALDWMANLGAWNMLIGFGFMVVGLLMTMGWR